MITINRGVMRQARRNKHLTWQAVSDLTLIPVGTLLKWRDSNYDISNRIRYGENTYNEKIYRVIMIQKL